MCNFIKFVWLRCEKHSQIWPKNGQKNSHFSFFSQTVHTIRTKASQKEKDLSRLLYRICGSGFTSIPKQKVLTFFGTMRLFGFVRLFSALWDFFSKFFKCPQRVLFSIFLIFCKRTNVKKSQRVPFFRIFGTFFCLRFSVEKEWVFCCFQLGKNGFRGLRVSLRVFFGAVKLMKF